MSQLNLYLQKCKQMMLLLTIILFVNCESDEYNSTVYYNVVQLREAVDKYKELYDEVSIKESFIFFTDPHLLGSNSNFTDGIKSSFISSFASIRHIYDAIPVKCCISGGDWLKKRDTQESAKEKLLFADRQMKMMLPRYYKMMGNHDTNYQGIVSVSDSSRGDLPRHFIDETYFSETRSAYYSFEGENTVFYVFDSGNDWEIKMNDYRWEQIHWFASHLLSDEGMHRVILIHMFYGSIGETCPEWKDAILPMSEQIIKIVNAFNAKEVVSIEDRAYNFTQTNGKIRLILSGHHHQDYIDMVGRFNDIPVVRTCNFIYENKPTFDICLLNYSSMYADFIRVGAGISRRVELSK